MTALKLLVTVGSDYHPFDRLIEWVDLWLDTCNSPSVEPLVQHGSATPPRHGTAHAYLPHDQLMAALRRADVVVTQGGPMGIVEARRFGLTPIVVPRLRRLGEVVDDHQVQFCRQLAATGDIVLAETAEELARALELAAAAPQSLRFPPSSVESEIHRSVDRFAELVAGLAPARSQRPRIRRASLAAGSLATLVQRFLSPARRSR